jgi:hypothetical protein
MTAGADTAFYDRALRRVYRFQLAAAAVGLAIATWTGGWPSGAGFLLGAAAAYLSFTWIHQAVEAMGPGARPTRKRVFVFVAGRYIILGLGGYVIVKIFGMNAIAALSGLFVPVAAVIIEIIYELTTCRNMSSG